MEEGILGRTYSLFIDIGQACLDSLNRNIRINGLFSGFLNSSIVDLIQDRPISVRPTFTLEKRDFIEVNISLAEGWNKAEVSFVLDSVLLRFSCSLVDGKWIAEQAR